MIELCQWAVRTRVMWQLLWTFLKRRLAYIHWCFFLCFLLPASCILLFKIWLQSLDLYLSSWGYEPHPRNWESNKLEGAQVFGDLVETDPVSHIIPQIPFSISFLMSRIHFNIINPWLCGILEAIPNSDSEGNRRNPQAHSASIFLSNILV